MKIHNLEYLIDIAHTQSINYSAERFYISQQSMSRAIQSMETELGCKLLDRTYTGVSLTEAGKVVVEKGQLIVNLMQAIQDELVEIAESRREELTGELVIKGNFQAMSSIIPSVLSRFARHYPNVSLNIDGIGAYQVTRAVYQKEADIGLVGIAPKTVGGQADYQAMLQELAVKKLYEDDILICLSKSLSLAQRDYLEPKDLLRVPQINYGYQPPVNELLFARTGMPKQLLATTSIDLFKKTIRQGLGFGLSNGLDARLNYSKLERQDIAFLPLHHEDNRLVYLLLMRAEKASDPLLKAFAASVESFIASL